jgi:hypothetical protein
MNPTPLAAAAAAVLSSTDVALAFDPLAFEDVPSGELRIKDPTTGARTSMVITLAGPEHPGRKARLFARQRRLRAAFQKTGKMPTTDPQDDELDELEDLLAGTLGWTGSAVQYTAATARQVYTDPKRRWLRDQVRAGLDERELFTQACVPG